MAAFAIKADLGDPDAAVFAFEGHKTMYGGKAIAVGDTVFVFASGTDGRGLVARGIVTASKAVPRTDAPRQTPRVSVAVARTARATRPLGRAELRAWRDRRDGSAEAELDFKLYRQATDKIVGLTPVAEAFLDGLFQRRSAFL